MKEVEIAGMYDSADSAADVARALNTWFQWIMEADGSDMPDIFEDFGLLSEEYELDRENDTDWEETPYAVARSNHVVINVFTSETQEFLQELLEAMGAFEVEIDAA